MRMYSALLLISALFAVSRGQQIIQQHLREGNSTILECDCEGKATTCSWKHVGYAGLDVDTAHADKIPPGYHIFGDPEKGTCHLNITSVDRTDHGQWTCTISGCQINVPYFLTVVAPPTAVYLEHNGTRLAPGEFKTDLTVSDSGEVKVECVSEYSRPQPINLEWDVNGKNTTSDEQNVSYNATDITHTRRDTIILTYPVRQPRMLERPVKTTGYSKVYRYEPDPYYEKEVTCSVWQEWYQGSPFNVTARFGQPYETNRVFVSAHPVPNDPTKILLSCVANGIPIPTYWIQKISSLTHEPVFYQVKGEEEPVSYNVGEGGQEKPVLGQTRVVTERGVYVCRATYPGVHLDKVSNQLRLTFDQDDPISNKNFTTPLPDFYSDNSSSFVAPSLVVWTVMCVTLTATSVLVRM